MSQLQICSYDQQVFSKSNYQSKPHYSHSIRVIIHHHHLLLLLLLCFSARNLPILALIFTPSLDSQYLSFLSMCEGRILLIFCVSPFFTNILPTGHCIPPILSCIKNVYSSQVGWNWLGIERIGEKENAYRIKVGKPEGNRQLKIPRHMCVDNIKTNLIDIGWDGTDWLIWLRIGTSGGLSWTL
jgi:hypothetical protein